MTARSSSGARVPRLAGRKSKAEQHGQLAGEGLCRGNADLGACESGAYDRTLTSDRGCRDIDNRQHVLTARFGIAQGGERIGSLTRLRHHKHQTAWLKRGVAVSQLRRDLNVHRKPRQTLEPIRGDKPGKISRAASRNRDSVEAAPVEGSLERQQPACA